MNVDGIVGRMSEERARAEQQSEKLVGVDGEAVQESRTPPTGGGVQPHEACQGTHAERSSTPSLRHRWPSGKGEPG